MSCNAFISWETQDNIKLRSIITQSIIKPADKIDGQFVAESSGGASSPKRFINLCPFEHPELTNPSRDACELRLHCDAHHNLSIRLVRITATARCTEVYDRRGEFICTVKGIPVGGGGSGATAGATNEASWHSFVCTLPEPNFEVKFKFMSLVTPGSLRLTGVSVLLEEHSWPAHPADRALSVTSLLERLSEVELSPQARSLLNLVTAASGGGSGSGCSGAGAGAGRSTSPVAAGHHHTIGGLRQWLDVRLEAMERRLEDRLTRLEARLLADSGSAIGQATSQSEEAATP